MAAEFDVLVAMDDCLLITHRPCGAVIIDGYISYPLDALLDEVGKHVCTK